MLIRRALAIVAVLPVACGSSLAATSRTKVPCGPPGDKTLAADPVARVYQVGSKVYGCAAGSKRTYQLGAGSRSFRGSGDGPYALAGRVVAYGESFQGVDTRTASVVVLRLSNGKQLHSDPATSHNLVESVQSVKRLVLKADGAVAWSATDTSIIGRGTELEVNKHDGRGYSLLDSGARVDVNSLRLHGSRLSWRDGTSTRTSTLS